MEDKLEKRGWVKRVEFKTIFYFSESLCKCPLSRCHTLYLMN